VLETNSFIPGWYGKIPSLGDFASRRLPQEFISSWDAWLQHALAASRADLGPRWLDIYLTSPIWRFALLPGVIGPTAWAGLMMPSVDKVGRHFPLTIATPLENQPAIIGAMLATQGWYAAVEKVALATLNIDFPPEQLEAALSGLSFPTAETQHQDLAARKLARWFQSPTPACSITLPTLEGLPSVWATTAHDLLLSSANGKSLWWTAGENGEQATLNCFTRLPSEEYFASLLEGVMLSDKSHGAVV
jgi:type VI secretion system protein ImpM